MPIANVTLKQFTKLCFALWIYNVIKTMGKTNTEDVIFMGQEQKENKSVIVMISVDGRRTVFIVNLNLKGNRLNQDIKK